MMGRSPQWVSGLSVKVEFIWLCPKEKKTHHLYSPGDAVSFILTLY
jgi:hypothetical protein